MLMCSSGKRSHQNEFHIVYPEVSVGQSGNQLFSSLLRQACFSHQHPHRRLSAWLSHCLGESCTLLESRDVVTVSSGAYSWLRTSRRFHPSEVVAVQALFQAWPLRLRCLDGFYQPFVLCCQGCFALRATALGQSSPSHYGRYIRSVLGSIMSYSYTICSVGTAVSSVMTVKFHRASLIPFAQKKLHAVRFPSGTNSRLQLQSGWRRGIIFQLQLQPRSRHGKTVSNDNIR